MLLPKFSPKEQNLFDLLMQLPPNLDCAEQLLSTSAFSPAELGKTAHAYCDECFCEAGDYAYENGVPHTETITPNLHSTYIADVIHLLLRYGLDPNVIIEDENIMDNLRYVDNEYLAADALCLLLQHGGNANVEIPGEGELIGCLDFDVWYGAIEQKDRARYASLVHCWMVLLGSGNYPHPEKIQLFREYASHELFCLSKLRNHRNYDFGITHLQNDYAISIYDKETHWEVARII